MFFYKRFEFPQMLRAADFWITKQTFPAGKISAKQDRKPRSGSRSNPAREHWYKFLVVRRSDRDMRRASASDELHFSVNNFIKTWIFRLRAREVAGIFHRIYGLDFKKIMLEYFQFISLN